MSRYAKPSWRHNRHNDPGGLAVERSEVKSRLAAARCSAVAALARARCESVRSRSSLASRRARSAASRARSRKEEKGGMAAFWPTPAGEESDPEVAKAMNTTPKIVISRTLAQAGWAGTRIISHHAEEELAKLKQQPGKDIVIPGSSTLTAGLLQTGLLDELRIMVNPVILGQGRSLFAGAGRTSLKLLKTRQFTSGNVLLYYQPITN